MKKITIGIMSQEKIRERMLAIAKGEYKPKSGEPKIWFISMKSLAEVLSDENRALHKTIRDAQPESITGRRFRPIGAMVRASPDCLKYRRHYAQFAKISGASIRS